MEKKKSQKAKAKSSEGRKQLSCVRVIQRNLVYIVGLPLNLADEEVVSLQLSLSLSLSHARAHTHTQAHTQQCVRLFLNFRDRCQYFMTFHAFICSFSSVENILVSMGRFSKYLCLVRLLVLFSNIKTIRVVCKFYVSIMSVF